MKLTNNEKKLFECFRENPIPAFIKHEAFDGLDLMLCNEELCNQAYSFEANHVITNEKNSWGEDENLIFNGRYENALLTLASITKDDDLKFHCLLSLAVLHILTIHTK